MSEMRGSLVQSPTWLFLADHGPGIGAGHLSRCAAIACELARRGRSVRIHLRSPDPAASAAQCGESAVVVCHPIATPLRELLDSLAEETDEGVLIDSYRLGAEPGLEVVRARGLALALIEDAPRPLAVPPDVLIDPTPGRVVEDWRHHAGAAAVLTGTEHALLAPGLAATRPVRPPTARRDVRHIVIAFGASDSRDASSLAVQAARMALPLARITVLATSMFPQRDRLRALCDGLGAEYLQDCREPGSVLAGADLAIGAAGVSALERACLGLAQGVIALVDRQIASCHAAVELGLATYFGPLEALDRDALAGQVAAFAGDVGARAAMAARGHAVIDGQGAWRVTEALMAAVTAA